MNRKMKWLIGMVGASLFAIMAFVGVKFILQAENSASGIQTQVPSNKPNLNVNNLDLSPKSSHAIIASDTFSLNPALNQIHSTGNDVAITNGEFAYRAGQPAVELVLKNQANFPIQAVHISLFLRLNGDKKNAAQEIAVPIALPQTLLQGESVRIQVPALQAAWSAEQVAQAQSRQVLAQVVSVSSAIDDESNDYPQTSEVASLKQTANDWTLPDDEQATPDPNYVEPQAIVEKEVEPEPDINPKPEIDVVQQILDEQKLPEKNEVGVISHQEKTLKK